MLSLAFRDPFGHLVTDIPPTRTWAPPFFSNLLPEGPLREYLARGAGIDPLPGVHRNRTGGHWVIDPARLGDAIAGHPHDERVSSLEPPMERGAPYAAWPTTRSRRFQRIAAAIPIMTFSLPGVQLKLSAKMTAAGRMTIPVQGNRGDPGSSSCLRWCKISGAAGTGTRHDVAGRPGRDRRCPKRGSCRWIRISNLPRGMGPAGGEMALAVRRFDRAGDGTPSSRRGLRAGAWRLSGSRST